MKINLIPFAFAFLCLVGASTALSLMGKYSEPVGLGYTLDGIRQNFQIVAGFFALVSTFFLSVSFTKKA